MQFNDALDGIERARLTWRLLRDPRVPMWTKLMLPAVAGTYLILPIDLIPDFFLGLGQLDDLSIIGITMFAMTRVLPKFAPATLVEEHLEDLRGGRRGRNRDEREFFDADYTVVNERRSDIP
jgi:uncharacterized membrane protein YkvA (DUF1232 family)